MCSELNWYGTVLSAYVEVMKGEVNKERCAIWLHKVKYLDEDTAHSCITMTHTNSLFVVNNISASKINGYVKDPHQTPTNHQAYINIKVVTDDTTHSKPKVLV